MIQFKILSGKTAGTNWAARRFPVLIGRAESSDLRLVEPGVWDTHAVLSLGDEGGFILKSDQSALMRVNSQSTSESVLRNGDLIELGSVKVQFWLSAARQSRLRFSETLAWATIVLVTVGQIMLLYWLVR